MEVYILINIAKHDFDITIIIPLNSNIRNSNIVDRFSKV